MLKNTDAIDKSVSRIKTFLFLQYLGGNIKRAAVNATQNLTLGLPVLGREIGIGSAYAAYFKDAVRAVADQASYRSGKGSHSKLLTAEESAFLDDFYNSGQMRKVLFEELMGAEDSTLNTGFKTLAKMMGLPMQMVERFNRSSLALAAYRAARNGKVTNKATLAKYGEHKGNKWDDQKARKFAGEIVDEAHFVYGKGNRPQMLRHSNAGRMLNAAYTFRTFSHSLASWLWRNGVKGDEGAAGRIAVAHCLLATWALGGLTAVPLYNSVSTVLRQAFGNDPDDLWEKTFGLKGDALDTVMYGLPSLSGVYIGGSLNLELPAVTKLKSNKPWLEQVLDGMSENVFGVVHASAKKVSNAGKFYASGQYGRMAEEILPTAFGNVLKATRQYTKGNYTASGRPIGQGNTKVSTGDAVAMAAGFQIASRAKDWHNKTRKEDLEQRKQAKQSDLVTEFTLARRDMKGPSLLRRMNEIRKEVKKWNDDNPGYEITMDKISSLAKQRARPVK